MRTTTIQQRRESVRGSNKTCSLLKIVSHPTTPKELDALSYLAYRTSLQTTGWIQTSVMPPRRNNDHSSLPMGQFSYASWKNSKRFRPHLCLRMVAAHSLILLASIITKTSNNRCSKSQTKLQKGKKIQKAF